ncbi:MAG TPA: hypothetical protein VFQ26_09615, partial [Nitrospiraceae bacterium]|nr:hypothetical protein [Nitrospiraceae bacterium]
FEEVSPSPEEDAGAFGDVSASPGKVPQRSRRFPRVPRKMPQPLGTFPRRSGDIATLGGNSAEIVAPSAAGLGYSAGDWWGTIPSCQARWKRAPRAAGTIAPRSERRGDMAGTPQDRAEPLGAICDERAILYDDFARLQEGGLRFA